jgi:hypothetical protein
MSNDAPKFLVHADTTRAEEVIKEASASLSDSGPSTHAEGGGVIKAGENMVGVTHGLEGSPRIALFLPDDFVLTNYSYVIMVGNAFQVNLESPVKEDTPFTWTADL